MARSLCSFHLTLVRHGQTDANKSIIVQGHLNTSLSDEGRIQAKRLAVHFQNLGTDFDRVYSSDLIRALETCRSIVGGNSPDDRIRVDTRLRERGYGVMEGKGLQELRAAAKAAGHNDKNYSCFVPPGAESLSQVRDRIKDFLFETVIRDATPGQRVLVVTHGGVIREFLRFFRDSLKCLLPPGLTEPIRVSPNTGVSTFCLFYSPKHQLEGNMQQALVKVQALRVNDVSHLDPDSVLQIHEFPISQLDNNSTGISESLTAAPLEAL